MAWSNVKYFGLVTSASPCGAEEIGLSPTTQNYVKRTYDMIFSKLNTVLTAVVITLGFASSAMAAGNQNQSFNSSLNVIGSSGINSKLDSVFTGNGENKADQYGKTMTNIESSLNGLCGPDCGNASLKANLKAMQGGSVLTKAGSDTPNQGATIENSGVFNSGVALGIKFGGKTTEASTEGAAGFANKGSANGTGGSVWSKIKSYGSGETESLLSTNKACPNCADIAAGTSVKSMSGLDMMSTATSGNNLLLNSSGLSESAVSVKNMFKKGNSQ